MGELCYGPIGICISDKKFCLVKLLFSRIMFFYKKNHVNKGRAIVNHFVKISSLRRIKQRAMLSLFLGWLTYFHILKKSEWLMKCLFLVSCWLTSVNKSVFFPNL